MPYRRKQNVSALPSSGLIVLLRSITTKPLLIGRFLAVRVSDAERVLNAMTPTAGLRTALGSKLARKDVRVCEADNRRLGARR